MIYWVLTDGIHPFDNNAFNVVQGSYDGRYIIDEPEAYDLVGWMISQEMENRPSI